MDDMANNVVEMEHLSSVRSPNQAPKIENEALTAVKIT
jgi:hypothetical protein